LEFDRAELNDLWSRIREAPSSQDLVKTEKSQTQWMAWRSPCTLLSWAPTRPSPSRQGPPGRL